MSILDKSISYFPSKNDTHGGVTVNLLQILNSTKHEAIINILRAERDEAIQKKIKEKLPCYTVAGVFTRRCEAGLILPSGLAAVDLDSAEDYDVTLLLNELKKIPYIAYIGLSCRGKRLFAIVPLLNPDKYARHYDRLIKSFEDVGLPMGDTCHKVISQPRFVSYNTSETSYFNHDAKRYNLLHAEKIHHYMEPVKLNSNSVFQGVPENPFKWCDTQFQKSNAFIEGQRHSYIVSLVRYCNIKGLSETDTLNGCIAAYDTEGFDELEISRIVKHIYLSHSSAHNTLPFKSSNKQVNENTGEARLNIADRDTLTPTLQVKQSYCLPPRLYSYGNYYFGQDGLLYNHRHDLPDLV